MPNETLILGISGVGPVRHLLIAAKEFSGQIIVVVFVLLSSCGMCFSMGRGADGSGCHSLRLERHPVTDVPLTSVSH